MITMEPKSKERLKFDAIVAKRQTKCVAVPIDDFKRLEEDAKKMAQIHEIRRI